MPVIAQAAEATEILSQASEHGAVTFVLIVILLGIGAFSWVWLFKFALPKLEIEREDRRSRLEADLAISRERLEEQKRHNSRSEELMENLHTLLGELGRALANNEVMARRMERYFNQMTVSNHRMTVAKKLELDVLQRIARKLGIDSTIAFNEARSAVDEAGHAAQEASKKTESEVNVIDDSQIQRGR